MKCSAVGRFQRSFIHGWWYKLVKALPEGRYILIKQKMLRVPLLPWPKQYYLGQIKHRSKVTYAAVPFTTPGVQQRSSSASAKVLPRGKYLCMASPNLLWRVLGVSSLGAGEENPSLGAPSVVSAHGNLSRLPFSPSGGGCFDCLRHRGDLFSGFRGKCWRYLVITGC